jgi:hypothetical protein
MRSVPAFQFTAYPERVTNDAMHGARVLLDACGAMVTDITPYSNKLIVFQVSVRLSDWDTFIKGLFGSDWNFDAPADLWKMRPDADGDGDVFGTVSIIVSGQDEETGNVIPAVPG